MNNRTNRSPSRATLTAAALLTAALSLPATANAEPPLGGPEVREDAPREGKQRRGDRAERGQRGQRGRDFIRNADTDGDRQLSAAEIDAAVEKMVAKILESGRIPPRADQDGDGELSPAELAAMETKLRERLSGAAEKMGQRRATMLENFDADGDGQLNEAERSQAKATLKDRMQERRGQRSGARKDGQDGRRAPRNAARSGIRSALRSIDTDQSRTIDETELAEGLSNITSGAEGWDLNRDGSVDELDAVQLIEIVEKINSRDPSEPRHRRSKRGQRQQG